MSAAYRPPSRPTRAENATPDRDRVRGGGGGGGRALLFEGMAVRLERTEYKLPIHVERNFLDWDDHRGGEDADGGERGDDNVAAAARRRAALPVFWHVLKSGGTSVKLMYAQCYHLVEACETGALIDAQDRGREGQRGGQSEEEEEEEEEEVVRGNYPNPWEWMQQQLLQPQQHQQAGRGDGENNERRRLTSMMRSSEGGERGEAPPPDEQRQQQQPQERQLRVVTSEDGRRYVNVDVTTAGGIREASELGFASSDLADVVFTPLVTEAARFLLGYDDDGGAGGGRRGRMFALFRHPVNRVVSIFYYLQSATWEPTYNPAYAGWTIDDYARSPYCESNWMVRTLLDKMTGPLEPEDVNVAIATLRRKCLVGLMEDMEGSVTRFHRYFRFRTPYDDALGCSRRNFATKGGNHGQNGHVHPSLDPESETYKILEHKNQLDVRLYDYAKELYAEQGEWMQRMKLI